MTNRENPIHRIKSYLGSGSKSKWYGSETLVKTVKTMWQFILYIKVKWQYTLISEMPGVVRGILETLEKKVWENHYIHSVS